MLVNTPILDGYVKIFYYFSLLFILDSMAFVIGYISLSSPVYSSYWESDNYPIR